MVNWLRSLPRRIAAADTLAAMTTHDEVGVEPGPSCPSSEAASSAAALRPAAAAKRRRAPCASRYSIASLLDDDAPPLPAAPAPPTALPPAWWDWDARLGRFLFPSGGAAHQTPLPALFHSSSSANGKPFRPFVILSLAFQFLHFELLLHTISPFNRV